jgi:hypothetical protein
MSVTDAAAAATTAARALCACDDESQRDSIAPLYLVSAFLWPELCTVSICVFHPFLSTVCIFFAPP